MTNKALIITKEINSSQVDTIWYSPNKSIMTVRFKFSDAIYSYSNISEEEHNSIIEAESIGKKLKEVVKGKPFEKSSIFP